MIPTLEALCDASLISSLDRHFAREMGRVGGEDRPEALAAVALASRETAAGHICLALERLSRSDVWEGLSTESSVPEVSVWREVLSSSPLVVNADHTQFAKAGGPRSTDLSLGKGEAFGDARPLVLDASGRLYLRRFWIFQQRLAEQLRKRAALRVCDLHESELVEGLDRLFGSTQRPEGRVSSTDGGQGSFDFTTGGLDHQRLAAAIAVSRRLSVISGGPGTGKTATAGKILALIVEQEMLSGDGSPPRLALVAPTGKAAATLAGAIASGVASLPCSEGIKAAIPAVAQTIHRCLGVRGGALPEFRYHAGNRLPIDVLLVDEASMVDLFLMTRLLSAVPDEARVILLGDEHQLASVEAGAVLGDICAVGNPPGYSPEFASRLSSWMGADVEVAGRDVEPVEIRDSIVRLTHSYRYDTQSGIGALARAINRGDVSAALEILDDPNQLQVSRFDLDPGGASYASLHRQVALGFREYLEQEEPEQMLERFSHFRVLSPERKGPGGVEELNRQIEAVLRREKLIDGIADRYRGRPLMIKTNDYAQNLFNGDVGIVSSAGVGSDNFERVIFHSERGTARSLAYSRLPDHETAFAMTIHKSQGSEFDQVAVVLPEFSRERASRELLYTAVTRARSQVALYASQDAIAQAMGRKIERVSGLGDALRSPS